MQIKAENVLNPFRHHLSNVAKKRIKWLYILYYECDSNVQKTANKIGISRQWLSFFKKVFENNNRNPRSLEPKSTAPNNTTNRQKISKETENKIIEIRDKYSWGKNSISVVLLRDFNLKAGPTTVNRYLHKHQKIDPKISERNKKAWAGKKLRETLEKNPSLLVKYRPPTEIKDYEPGALMEKDMKFIPTKDKSPLKSDEKYHIQNYFNYQHSMIDSFTRIKTVELVQTPDSQNATEAYKAMKTRLPFKIACINTDNGGENGKNFKEELAKEGVVHFWSKTSTPTDNPRVERSHLTDDRDFWRHGHNYRPYEEQKKDLKKWEHIYNWIRPHQALGYLTPIKFYELWKKDPQKAYAIKDEYKIYLLKQRKRLATSRKIKEKKQIETLMQFISIKLNQNGKQEINLAQCKSNLIECKLCHANSNDEDINVS